MQTHWWKLYCFILHKTFNVSHPCCVVWLDCGYGLCMMCWGESWRIWQKDKQDPPVNAVETLKFSSCLMLPPEICPHLFLLFKDQIATLFLEESPPHLFFFLFSNSHSVDTHRPQINSLLTFSLNFTRKRFQCISSQQSMYTSKLTWCQKEFSEFYLNIQI